ncbi:MAG: LamG domain-containing protein [Planctomycetes bacterium]|nr:LamG domain-containing protein [Planctomycetota bacterium]
MPLLRKPFSTGRVLLVLAALLMQAHVILAAEGGDLVSVPDDAAQAQAATLIREVYEQDYETAKTSADRTALAKKMIDQAARTLDDPVARFVLLRVARDMAGQAGDAETAVDAVDRIAKAYDVDAAAMKVDSLLKVAASAKSLDARKAVAEHSLALIQAALGVDDYRTVNRLMETALAAARRVRDGELVKKIMASRKEASEAVEAYAEIKKALAILDQKPTDPEANLAVGRYCALVKGDWEKGIAMLALGSDEALRTLARRELQGATSPQEQVGLADGWWTLAQSKSGPDRTALLLRGGTWYRQAKAGLSSGLARVRVDKRLEEIDKLGRSIPATRTRGLQLPEGAVLVMTFEPGTFATTAGRAYVSDLSGTNNHGLLQGGPTLLEGKAGAALKFDGVDDHILLPALRAHLVQDLKAITISVWVKPGDAKKYAFIFDVGDYHGGRRIGLNWEGGAAHYRFVLAQHRDCVSEITAQGQWRHLVARWDGSRQDLYLDGKLHHTNPSSNFTLSETTLSTETARIGGQATRHNREKWYFNGFIDEVAIFTRALSEEEIQTLHRMGSQGEPLQRTRRGKPVR